MSDVHNLRYLVDTIDERRLRSDLRKIRKYIKTVVAAEDARAAVSREQEDTPRRRPWSMADLFPDFSGPRGGIRFPTPDEMDKAAQIQRDLEARRGPLYDAIRHVITLSTTKTLDEIDGDDITVIIHKFTQVPATTGWREEKA